MSNHIICGKGSTNNKAHGIKASNGDLHIKIDSANTTQLSNINTGLSNTGAIWTKLGTLYPKKDLEVGTLFNNQAVASGNNIMSAVQTQASNSEFVFYGEDTTSAGGVIKVFISDDENGTFYEALELLNSVQGTIYGRFPIYTKFFKVSYANTSNASTNITIKYSTKN